MRTHCIKSKAGLGPGKGFCALVLTSLISAVTSFSQTPTLAEALDTQGRVWASGGAGAWMGQTTTSHDGIDAAQSPVLGDYQESWIQTTVPGPGAVSFWWRLAVSVGSELRFQVNGKVQATLNDASTWYSQTVFLPTGNCILRWQITNTFSEFSNARVAWVDQVAFVPGATAPFFSLQPSNQTVFMDDNASFQSAASGTPPPHYQWYFNDAAIPDATNASLALPSVQLTNAGSYFVIVTNNYDSMTSSTAVLTVKQVPRFAFVTQGSGPASDRGNGIAVDDSGNMYVTGTFSDMLTLGTTNLVSAGGSDAFMAKYDRAGRVMWAKRVGGPGNDAGTAVGVDPFGSIYFSGIVTGLTGFDGIAWTNSVGTNGYMAKYNSSGSLLWVRTNPAAACLAFDGGGNIYLANLGPIFLDKYDSNGVLLYRQWALNTPSDAITPWTGPRGIAMDGRTNIYLVATYHGTLTFTNYAETNVVLTDSWSFRPPIALVKFNPAGQAIWARSLAGSYEDILADVFAVAVDDGGNAYVGGTLFYQGLLAKFDPGGSLVWGLGHLWNKSIAGQIRDIAILKNNLFLAGNFSDVNYRAGLSVYGVPMKSAGGDEAFVARLDLDGNVLEAKRAGGPTNDSVLAMALDKAGNPCITGYFQGSAQFGTETLTSGGLEDVFVARVQMAVPTLRATRNNNELRFSWPALADGFVLETSSSLSEPFSPSARAIQTDASGTEFFVTLPATESAGQFFRLQRP